MAEIIVACALLPKKVARYLTPRMLATAAAHGIVLKEIDAAAPLGAQGPFNVILHKLRPDADWEASLLSYVAAHPEVVVVDSIDRIRQLHNRATMLRPLQGEGITLRQPTHQQQPQRKPPQVVRVQAPLQVELLEGTSEAEAHAALAAAGLAPPLLCKPLWTDGRDGSHQLAVLHDLEALGRLLRGGEGGCGEFKPPLVVQQFVEHGGVLFKVYVLGERTYVTARPSLGETELEPNSAVQQLPRISCVSVFSKQHQQQEPPGGGGSAQQQEQAQQHQQQPSAALAAVATESVWQPPRCSTAPPAWLTSALAATLRQELGMSLFNFDLLIPAQTWTSHQAQHAADDVDSAPPLCYVVDVNYFPGVDKLPHFEERLCVFLLAAAAGGRSSSAAPQQQLGQLAAGATAAGVSEQQQAPAAEPPGRVSSSGGGACSSGRRLSSSSGCGSLEGATAAAGQWDASKQQGLAVGSSPPLQVAGCS